MQTEIPNWLERCAETMPDSFALQVGERIWNFKRLHDEVLILARKLASMGITTQTRVAILAGNTAENVLLVHALIALRAVLVPLNLRLTPSELLWQLRDAQATYLLSDPAHAAQAARLSVDHPLQHGTIATITEYGEVAVLQLPEMTIEDAKTIDLDSLHLIMYTSGTTGAPKGVLVTYGMHWWNAMGSAIKLGIQADDRWLACLPLFHIGGLAILMRSVIYGHGVVLVEKFDAAVINRTLRESRCTIISVVAFILQQMLAQQEHPIPDCLRCVLAGGGPVPLPLLEECARRAIPVVQTYGLTESCSQAVTLAPHDAVRKLGSAGQPLAAVRLAIMEAGQPLKNGEVGVIALKGPGITQGYLDRPEESMQAFVDGWFLTGDLGYLDQEGYLYVLDRRSDLIISGGENIYPAQIEAVLQTHPDVLEVGVCGQSDERWGQVPIAFVVLRSGSITTEEQLQSFAQQHLARYKVPQLFRLVSALPRNGAGKLLRRALPELLEASSISLIVEK